MKLTVTAGALLALTAAAPAFAQDAAVGEKEFNKCKACHMIQDESGKDVVKGGKTGPNLWGIVGREIADINDLSEAEAEVVIDVLNQPTTTEGNE